MQSIYRGAIPIKLRRVDRMLGPGVEEKHAESRDWRRTRGRVGSNTVEVRAWTGCRALVDGTDVTVQYEPLELWLEVRSMLGRA